MLRPIGNLWPYWGSSLYALVVFLPPICLFAWHRDFGLVAISIVILAVAHQNHPQWLGLLLRRVRSFRTRANRRVVMHYDRLLEGTDLAPFDALCHAELDRLGRWFGHSLHGRLVVYLFARCQEFAEIFGFECGGYPLSRARAILVASDNNVEELVQHELAHVLADRWNPHAPEVLREGLAVWLQPAWGGCSLDTAARALLSGMSAEALRRLIPQLFFSSRLSRFDSYVLAGSFTGFLIQRYGRDRYERLYRTCRWNCLGVAFKKCLGVTLEDAEFQWLEAVARKPGCGNAEDS